jgi:phage N-6-adenine-methyltransferase
VSGPTIRRGKSKQDYRTPQDVITAVKRRFGIESFLVDLAADAKNAHTFLYFDEAHDSLTQAWGGLFGGFHNHEYGWLNPPFSHITPWVKKSYEESRKGARILVLIPASTGSNWWKDHVHGKAFVLLLNGRITFEGCQDPYPKDCALLVYGPDVAPGYDVWSWKE